MRKALLVAAAVATLAAAVSCDLSKLSAQSSASKVMVATVLATPALEIPPEAWVGFDANFFTWDSGFDASFPWDGGFDAGGFDAGGLQFDGGLLTVPPQTAAYVFFGERTGNSLDAVPTAISGATATVAANGATISLAEQGSGNYATTSLETPSLAYRPGADYQFTVVSKGATYTGVVQSSPPLERISAFHPAGGFLDLVAGADFTFHRPDPPGHDERTLGFVTVFPISFTGGRGEPTYTSVPATPLQFLKLIALPSEWKKTELVVPGSAFPEASKNYVIVFQTVKTGTPQTENLFVGSAILAGTADMGEIGRAHV